MFQNSIFRLGLIFLYVCLTNGLRCQLKGLKNNKMQCLLHDRGINAKEASAYKDGSHWKSNSPRNKEDLEPWKYSTGLDRNRTFATSEDGTDFKRHVRNVMTATRWCGDIDNRESQLSHEDLAYFLRTNKCCKQHDECNFTIGVKESKQELVNSGLLQRFHCDCEKQFQKCLKDVRNRLADRIGFTYFTIFGPQCFKEDYPIVNCTTKKMYRCLKYFQNRTEEKKYQWFDVPFY